MTEFRGGTLRGVERGGSGLAGGTLRDMENNSTLLREIDNDRRSTLRDVRYATTSSYISEHQTGTVFIRVSVQDLKVQKCLQFELDESVWHAKQRILTIFAKDLKDALNYGLYMPPINGRAGKFLDEERMLREYPLHGPIGFVEFKYKRRVYKVIHLNPRKLKQLHNKTNFRQLIDSVKNATLSKINKLTNKGLDPNLHDSSGETPLSYAVALPKDKCREVIITLVSGGGHIDFRTRQGQTPMHKAILHGNQTAVKTLLDLGASTNYKDGKGLTPLYYSVLYGKNAACAEMLLHERAIIGTQDEQGWYEVHQACKLGLVQHLEHLMFYGADLDVMNASGNTALHICAVNNNEQCARILLFRGANKHISNYNNQTPQQVAIIAGNVALAELIKNFEENDVVLFREMPSFSSRRPRLSMYGSTLSLISRSRSDPKLNISSAMEEPVSSEPPSMRSLPQPYQMYSDSGSYTASRGSDSPRSMSISSNSSGPGSAGTLRVDFSQQQQIQQQMLQQQYETQRRATYNENRTLKRSNTHAGNLVRIPEHNQDRENNARDYRGELNRKLEKHGVNFVDNGAVNTYPRKMLDINNSEHNLSQSSSTDVNVNFMDPGYYEDQSEFIQEPAFSARRDTIVHEDFVNPEELHYAEETARYQRWLQHVATIADQASSDTDDNEVIAIQASNYADESDRQSGARTPVFSGQVLEPSMLDRKFVCIEAYAPQDPLGLRLAVGDVVQVASVTDTGFWEGTVQDREGWFPAHHVQEVKLRHKAGSLGDLLAEESRESSLMFNRNTLATLVKADNQ